MTPADLRRVVVVEELDLSSGGRLAVVVRRSIQGDRYLGHLFALRLDGPVMPRPQALTRATVLWRGSPLRNVTSIRTPLLLLQAESDLRCPPQDNEQLFHRPASPSGGRWSTSSIPTSRTPMRPAVDRTGGSTG